MRWLILSISVLSLCVIAVLLRWSGSGERAAPSALAIEETSLSPNAELPFAQLQALNADRVGEPNTVRVPAMDSKRSETVEEPDDTVKLYGYVRFMDGSPAEWANVKVPTQSGTHRAVCDRSGWYEIDSIERGLWRINVAMDSEWRGRGTLDARGAESEFEQSFEMEILPPIRILILDRNGGPYEESLLARDMKIGDLEEALVAAKLKPSEDDIEPSGELTDSYLKTNLGLVARRERNSSGPPGTACALYLKEPAPVWVTLIADGRPLASEYVTSHTTEVVFVASLDELRAMRAGIRGRVIHAMSGRPLQAKLTIRRPGETRAPEIHEASANGDFRLDLLKPGKATLVAWLEGLAPCVLPIDLEAGQTLDLETLWMHDPVSISGWIDTSECPEEGWRCVTVRGRSDPEYVLQSEGVSRVAGEFEFTDLRPGEYSLQVETRTPEEDLYLSRVLLIDTSYGSIRGIHLTPQRTTRTKIELESADTSRFAALTVRTPEGLIVHSYSAGRSRVNLELLPGTYTLELSYRGVLHGLTTIKVGTEEQTIQLDFD